MITNPTKQGLSVAPSGPSDAKVKREFGRVSVVKNLKVTYGVYLDNIYKSIRPIG